jgi:tetratricopeptide (TPR) repeat protein
MKRIVPCLYAVGFSLCLGLSAIAETPSKELEIKDFEFLTEQCRSLLQTKAYTEALKACEQAIPLAPKKQKPIELWKYRAQALFGLEKYQEAIAAYDYVLKLEPNYSQGLIQRCEALSKLGQLESALESCDQGLQRDGDWGTINPAQGWYQQGLALRKSGRLKDAITAYDRALSINPDDALIKVEKCETQQQANPLMNRCLSEPEQLNYQPAALYRYGLMLWRNAMNERRQGKFYSSQINEAQNYLQQAIDTYDQHLKQNPKDVEGWMNQGVAAQLLLQHGKALLAFEQVLQLNPTSSQAMANRCTILNQQKQYQEALTACEAALKGDNRWQEQGLGDAWTQQSLALLGLKQYERAISAADRAIALNAEDAQAYHFKAIGQWNLKQFEKAQESAKIATEKDQSYAQAYFTLARTLSSLGKMDDLKAAFSQYQEASRLYKIGKKQNLLIPDSSFEAAIATNQAAVALRFSGEPALLSEIKVEERPRTLAGLYNKAAVLLTQRKYSEALSAFERVEKIQPNNPNILLGRAIALEQIATSGNLESLQKAIDAYDAVLALKPHDSKITSKREALLKRLNEQQEKRREQEIQKLNQTNQRQLTPSKK